MKFILLLLILLSAPFLNAQEWSHQLTFDSELNGGNKNAVTMAPDAIWMANTINGNEAEFHTMVRIVQTDSDGILNWSKHFNPADSSLSCDVRHIQHTIDGGAVVQGIVHPHNNTPYKQYVMKLSSQGLVQWSHVFNSSSGQTQLTELPDGVLLMQVPVFTEGVTRYLFVRLQPDGTLIDAYDTNLPTGVAVWKMHVRQNSVDVVFSNSEVVNVDFDLQTVNWSRRYFSMIGFAMNRAANGDFIYAAAQTAFPGYATVFRTDADGNLIWAKYVEAWEGEWQDQSTIFDIVGFHFIAENSAGDIVVMANSEGGMAGSLGLRFNADGELLEQVKLGGVRHQMDLGSSDDFALFGWPDINGDTGILERRSLDGFFPCDQPMSYTITDGTDSLLVSSGPLEFIETGLSSSPLEVVFEEVEFSVVNNCPLDDTGIETQARESVRLYPNPATNFVRIEGADLNTEIRVFDASGRMVLHAYGSTFDVGQIPTGVYLVKVLLADNNKVARLMVAP